MQTAAETEGAVKSIGEYSGHEELHLICSAFTSFLVSGGSFIMSSWPGRGIPGSVDISLFMWAKIAECDLTHCQDECTCLSGGVPKMTRCTTR